MLGELLACFHVVGFIFQKQPKKAEEWYRRALQVDDKDIQNFHHYGMLVNLHFCMYTCTCNVHACNTCNFVSLEFKPVCLCMQVVEVKFQIKLASAKQLENCL